VLWNDLSFSEIQIDGYRIYQLLYSESSGQKNDSRTLLKVGVSEIGLRSSCTDLDGCCLGIGTTLAFSSIEALSPVEHKCWRYDLLARCCKRGGAYKPIIGKPSGPGDFFRN
jgi:hypothetical protein